jgi:hypothetical protein
MIYYSNKTNKIYIIVATSTTTADVTTDSSGSCKEYGVNSLFEFGTKNKLEYIGVL